jgi:hypothetical protein
MSDLESALASLQSAVGNAPALRQCTAAIDTIKATIKLLGDNEPDDETLIGLHQLAHSLFYLQREAATRRNRHLNRMKDIYSYNALADKLGWDKRNTVALIAAERGRSSEPSARRLASSGRRPEPATIEPVQ